jgi:hypothetical protein
MEAWPRTPDSELAMFTKPLNLESLATAESRGKWGEQSTVMASAGRRMAN